MLSQVHDYHIKEYLKTDQEFPRVAQSCVIIILTLKVPIHDNCCTGTLLNRIITAQWDVMGDVESAQYELALLTLCPTIRFLSHGHCQRFTH